MKRMVGLMVALMIMVVWVSGGTIWAERVDRAVNVFTGLGTAASHLRGAVVDMGAEVQLTENVFGQILFDYYVSPSPEKTAGVDDSAYGINLYGVYKIPTTQRLNLLIKAGAHYTKIKATTSSAGYSVSVSSADFGICGGLGAEYWLSHRLAAYGGLSVKFVFADGDTGNWYKIHGGITYKVK